MTCFADLDDVVKPSFLPDSPLADWYQRVRIVPIDHLSLEDVCRAVRHDIFLAEVFQRAIEYLEDDPFCGDLRFGELITTLSQRPRVFWDANPDCFASFVAVASRLSAHRFVIEDLVERAREFAHFREIAFADLFERRRK
jgi:hypothetical protein